MFVKRKCYNLLHKAHVDAIGVVRQVDPATTPAAMVGLLDEWIKWKRRDVRQGEDIFMTLSQGDCRGLVCECPFGAGNDPAGYSTEMKG